jgi:NTE family protein
MGIKPVAICRILDWSNHGGCDGLGHDRRGDPRPHLDTIGKPSSALSRMWKAARPRGVKDAMEGGLRLGQFNVERILEGFLPEKVARRFEDLIIPTKIMVTDYYGHCEVVCSEGDLRKAIAASAAIPAVFRPVMLDDHHDRWRHLQSGAV